MDFGDSKADEHVGLTQRRSEYTSGPPASPGEVTGGPDTFDVVHFTDAPSVKIGITARDWREARDLA